MEVVNRITPYLSEEGIVLPEGQEIRDVPYYEVCVTLELRRVGEWSDYPEKQAIQVRSFQKTMPKDQLPAFEHWKNALAIDVCAVAASAVIAELKVNPPPNIQPAGQG